MSLEQLIKIQFSQMEYSRRFQKIIANISTISENNIISVEDAKV
jgi:hypothetical protein